MASHLDRHGTISLKIAALTFVKATALKAMKVRKNQTITFLHNRSFFLPFSPENICQQFDNLCTDICVATTDNSYVCQCHEGRELLEDKITCVKKTNIANNEIPQDLNNTDGE